MAQWTGQFSGLTHETRVQDLEVSLQQAIDTYKRSSEVERDTRLKTLRDIAERLRASRLKALKARLSKSTEPGRTRSDKQAAHLRTRVAQLEAQDVEELLTEFGLHGKSRT
jgi:hypothetical protein